MFAYLTKFLNLFQYELVAVSLPTAFHYNFISDPKNNIYYLIELRVKGTKRKYNICTFDESVLRQFPQAHSRLLTELNYWVKTGIFNDPNLPGKFDWKVSPRELKKRYLKNILSDD